MRSLISGKQRSPRRIIRNFSLARSVAKIGERMTGERHFVERSKSGWFVYRQSGTKIGRA